MATATEPPSAFFSYCRADSEFALKLAEDLKAAGANVWMDQLDIEPGEPWDRSVEEAVTKSPRMLVILSPGSVASDNVRDEVSFALSRQKRIIPVLYLDCDIPFRLARLQHIDFRSDYGHGLKALIKALIVEQAAQGHETPASAPSETTANSVSDADARAAQRARAEEVEREPIAAERARSQPDRAPLRETPSPAPLKYPAWVKIGSAVAAVVVASGLWYWTASRSGQQKVEIQKPEAPGAQSQVAQPQITNSQPASPPESNQPKGGSPSMKTKTGPANRATQSNIPAKAAPPAGLSTEVAELYREAQAGDSHAMFQLGKAYYTGTGAPTDYKQALIWYRKSAETGDAAGMNNLGWMYKYGFGLDEKSYPEALKWFRKAAEAGSASAMDNVGVMYRDELGVNKSYPDAVGWFRKAAEKGDPHGMNNLGWMYENGWGVVKDRTQAVTWYRKGAQAGSEKAKENLKRLGENLQ